jgi:hypothetical protein
MTDQFPEWSPHGPGDYHTALKALKQKSPKLAGVLDKITDGLYEKYGIGEAKEPCFSVGGKHKASRVLVTVNWRRLFKGENEFWVTAVYPMGNLTRYGVGGGPSMSMDICHAGRIHAMFPSPVAAINNFDPPYDGHGQLEKALLCVARDAGISRVRYSTLKH